MKKILFVLDKEIKRNNSSELFEGQNYKYFIANSVSIAQNLIETERPEVIIYYSAKNSKEKLQFLTEIRNKFDLYYPIVVLITNDLENQEIRKIMELDVDDILFYPVTKTELLKTIRKQIKKRENLVKYLSRNLLNKDKGNKSLSFEEPLKSDYIFLDDKHHPGFYPLKSIIYIKSLGDYTKLCIEGKRKIVLHKTLSFWESYLPSSTFLRIHRQTIINLNYVETVERSGNYNYKIKLRNVKEIFTISQRYSKKIKNRLGVS